MSRLPQHVNALAILVPRRAISTEPHNASSTSTPPPGFNTEQAKKQIKKDEKTARSKPTDGTLSALDIESTSKTKPTAESKTDASDEMSLAELAGTRPVEATKGAKKEHKKLTLGQRIKKEVAHYWDGTKLLATEVKISSRLALKMAAGYELSRREHRQLGRTVQDLGRLVPFSVFVIVPFAELLLPVALKLFPNLLPSTYEGQKSKDKKAGDLRATRKEVSNLLRSTLKETGLPLNPVVAQSQKEAFAHFFRKVRATGESPSAEEVIKICRFFKDDLTLDNLSRPQLVGMCRYMNLNTFGTDAMLRYQVRHRMRQIKRDDKAISYESVDSLSVPELQTACQSRGLRTHGVSPGRLRDDLQAWLDLRLKHGVPSTLLVLSNAFIYTQGKEENEFSGQVEALTGVLSSIPEELFHEIELEVHTAEGAATNKQRLEVLKEQEELIEEENEQNEENDESGAATPRDMDNIDEEKEERRLEAEAAGVDVTQVDEAMAAEKEPAEQKKVELQARGKDTNDSAKL